MKKKTGTYNGIYGRKWRLIWTVLILIFLLTSVSITGAGNSTESQASNGTSPEENIEASNGADSQGSTGVNSEQKIGVDNVDKVLEQKQDYRNIDWTENWENTEEELQQEDSRVDKTENWENTEELEREHDRNTEWVENWENTEEELQQEDSRVDKTENWENTEELEREHDRNTEWVENWENTEEELQQEDSKIDEIENWENTEEELEQEDNISKDNQQNTQEKLEQKDNSKSDSKGNKESTGKGPEKVDNRKTDQTGSQGSTGEKLERKDNINKGNQQNTQEKLEQNQGAKDKREGKKSSESNLKLKTKVDNVEYSSGSVGAKTELKTGVYGESKSLKSLEVKPEIEPRVRNGTQNLENENVSPVIHPDSLNSTNLPAEKVTPETKSEESSWNNLKFILSYPYSLRSFYTVNESVKISYKGPEAFGQQRVDIYLIKERNPGFPEEAVSNGINESAVSLEDVLNENTESYVQIPATLNAGGDLSPLTLGPLTAGSYWVLITLAGNETEKPESEKEILLANYFEVLKYEMKAYAPDTLKEGENFEVNLSLKNAPAQNSYTYWAVLLREDVYKEDEGVNPSWMTAGTRPLVNGVDIIKSLETNLTKYESRAGKDELKSEIQTLIGKGNGTINIGEENQSTLSLKSHELPPGDYILLAGAYENDEDIAGIAQKELRISAENSYGLDSESSSRNHTFGNISSMKNKASPFMGINSILETPKTLMFEDIKPNIQAKSIVEVVRNPPKAPSFLLGFAGTLLIMLAILRIKR